MNRMDAAEILQLLATGELELEGYLPWSSNYTFLARVCADLDEVKAVYKPRRGERPLWDFVQGTLYRRERAAFLVSKALGWDLVPPTVLRDGPHGPGSLQLFIEHDPEIHYFTFEGHPRFRRPLQQIALLDMVINNADRKGGHVLLEETGDPTHPDRVWAIDHGVCFHSNYKLRTVIWEFSGQPIPPPLLADLAALKTKLSGNEEDLLFQLRQLLTGVEVTALQQRVARLLKQGRFWEPGVGRHYPWPPV
ncbi:MAG: SCO1664 family protein [Anaerolineae bacterium]